ncbi:aliphatic sulfonate ABC transporter substrate-binding protein [Brucella sp. 2716]|uniref:aliphatic sulfonate ABC transporter substrate-binding protein n=1 Tax=Brucella sp. 2716 TaxID=2975052 RepID=UPI00217CC95F|nr:aliphatic sulfonate ABC transporter substrate-binding protein [Brucella sp. 2716]UWF60508.1 aliphatic sulfonate ABC transporter substrate-binding protein [Brucella sp. 2716]
MKRRTFLAMSLALTFLPSVALADNIPVRVGYIADYWGTSITAIASEKGLWEKHGLDADTRVFTNGPIQVQALGAGSLDFGYIGPGALWLPASGKAKIVAINSVGFSDRVIAQEGFKSMADLKGKKIGVPEGTSGDMLLRLALGKAGMKLDDVQVIKMDPSTVVSAFASKQIDAAGIWYPLIGTIKEHVPGMVELAANSDFFPDKTFPSAFIARNEIVAENPEAVKRMIAVIKEAEDFRTANPEQSVDITAKFLKVDKANLETEAKNGKSLTSEELVKLTRDGSVNGWLSGMADMFVTFGKLKSPLDPKDYYLADYFTAK